MKLLPVMLLAAVAAAQTSAKPQFEVTAVKPNSQCGGPGRGSGGSTSPGRLAMECAELRDLILTAYGIFGGGSSNPRIQVLGGPAWIDSDRYDILAKAESNPPVSQMYGPMMQALLEDRFKLRVHRETRDAPVYFLTVARGGPKLKAATPGSRGQKRLPEGVFEMNGATMADFSTQLAIRLDRDVIDRTGIAGMFDIHLEASPADLALRFVAGREDGVPPSVDTAAQSIFTALQQQLGLKLEAGKGPLDVLVIDRLERPTAN